MSKIAEVRAHVEIGKTKIVPVLVQQALDEGHTAVEILQAMIDGMGVVGDKFSAGEIFVPEMLIAAKAMAKGVEVLKPHLAGESSLSLGTCVIGTVQGDLHDIGKNLVASMLEGGGFQVVDLGVDVPAQKFVDAAKEQSGSIVAMSALLTTTMTQMKSVIKALEEAGIRQQTKVIIGGAPITQQYADEIGADGYGDNASTAVALARKLVAA